MAGNAPTSVEDAQLGLFGAEELPAPPPPVEPYQSVYVHFETLEDLAAFGRLIGLPLTTAQRWLRYPFPKSVAALPAEPPVDPVGDVESLLAEAEEFVATTAPVLGPDAAEARSLVDRLAKALRRAWSSIERPEDAEP